MRKVLGFLFEGVSLLLLSCIAITPFVATVTIILACLKYIFN